MELEAEVVDSEHMCSVNVLLYGQSTPVPKSSLQGTLIHKLSTVYMTA